MSLEVRATSQILLVTLMESLVWHQRLVQLCSTHCRSKIVHSIEIKTTLSRPSNPSGADGLQIIFLALIVFSQEVIVSFKPFSALSTGCELVKPQLLTHIPVTVRTSLFLYRATYYTAAILTISHLTSAKYSLFSAFLAWSAIPIQLFSILTAVSQEQLFLVF